MPWPPLKSPSLIWDNNIPKSKLFKDIYFSPESGEEESSYVFLKGIDAPEYWEGVSQFSICELGFGTGLNFLKTWEQWRTTRKENAFLDFVSLEGLPLPKKDLEKALSAFPKLTELSNQLVKSWPLPHPGYHRLYFPEDQVRLTLLFGDVDRTLPKLTGTFDAWYLDGFAPKQNPDMWSETVFSHIKRLSKPNCKIATFTAAGFVKRTLEKKEFKTEKTKGFGKKRERLLAYQNSESEPIKPHLNSKKIAIIGAGVAGASLTYALKLRGANVTLIDRAGFSGAETSGNPVALMAPKLNLNFDTYGRLFPNAFIYTSNLIEQFEEEKHEIYLRPKGLSILALNEKDQKRQKKLFQKLNWPNSDLCHSTDTEFGSLTLPNAGSINTRNFLNALIQNTPIIKGEVLKLSKYQDKWRLDLKNESQTLGFDIVIFANALDSFNSIDLPTPLIPNRGQISYIQNDFENHTKSFGHYFSPPLEIEGQLSSVLGATYDQWDLGTHPDWSTLRKKDHDLLVTTLSAVLGGEGNFPLKGRASLRATTLDHMPIAGPIINPKKLNKIPTNIYKPNPDHIPSEVFEKGLFILTGLGSRGFQTAPLLAEYIVSLVEGTSPPIDKEIMDAIHPARFILKNFR